MASGDITYGTRTVLADVSRLHSNVTAFAEAFGEIQGAGEIGINIHLVVPINSSATGGTYDLYLVESQNGAEWTDNIDPSSAGDVVLKIADATLIKSADTTYDGTHRTEVEFHVQLPMLSLGQYVGFVLDNNSGQTIPASGADGDSVTYKVS
jgi:hypothetical protein